MDSPFKKFQQALREDSAEQLPTGFSWEAMQTGIHNKMEALEKAKKEKRRRLFWWYGLGLFLLMLLGAGGGYLVSQDGLKGQENLHAQTNSQQPLATAPTALKGENQTNSTADQGTAVLVTPSTPVAKQQNPQKQSSYQQKNPKLPALLSKPQISTTNQNLNPKSPITKQAPPTLLPNSSPAAALTNALSDKQNISALPTLSFTVEASDWAGELALHQPLPKEIPFMNPLDKAGWRLGFYGGSNRGSSQPIELANEQTKAEETGLFAPYFQLQLERSLNRNFFARGGLRWQQTNSFLHYTSTTSGTTLAQDVVLLRSINTSTGDTTLLRGDTLLASSSQRRLGQLNSRVSLQLPLSLGYRTSFGKWEAGLHAGAVLELRQRNAGLFPTADGSIQALENYPTEGPTTPLSIHLQAGGELGYRIAPRLLLGLQANLQQQGKGWHPSNLHKRRPALLSFGLGAVWQL